MIDINEYLEKFIVECKRVFEKRLLYVGLQGSYLRGEAHENSDIDIMVIIDQFSVKDMDDYRDVIERIGNSDKSCGFICGKDEMVRWNPLEVCQLRYTTKDIIGRLDDYLPSASREDEINYVKLSLGNLYHELCHRYIHSGREKSVMKLRGTSKGLFYLIQNLYYLESGKFILTKKELKETVSEEDRKVLEIADLPDDYDFDKEFDALIKWVQNAFLRIENI